MQVTEFSAHMRAMKVHDQGSSFSRYALPVHVVDTYQVYRLTAGNTDFDLEYKTTLAEAEEYVRDFVQKPKNDIVNDTEALGTKPTGADVDSFREKLDQRKEAALKMATEKITQIFNKMQTLGENHPEYQDTILSGTDKILGFISKLLADIEKFVSDLVRKIYEWIKDALNKVKSFFLDVGHSVSAFFGGAFLLPSSPLSEIYFGLAAGRDKGKFDWHESRQHHQIISEIEARKVIEIELKDPASVEEWKNIGKQNVAFFEGQNNTQQILDFISKNLPTVSLGILGIFGFIAYAISCNYEIELEVTNILKIHLKPKQS